MSKSEPSTRWIWSGGVVDSVGKLRHNTWIWNREVVEYCVLAGCINVIIMCIVS
jgi:hypothetical protein